MMVSSCLVSPCSHLGTSAVAIRPWVPCPPGEPQMTKLVRLLGCSLLCSPATVCPGWFVTQYPNVPGTHKWILGFQLLPRGRSTVQSIGSTEAVRSFVRRTLTNGCHRHAQLEQAALLIDEGRVASPSSSLHKGHLVSWKRVVKSIGNRCFCMFLQNQAVQRWRKVCSIDPNLLEMYHS